MRVSIVPVYVYGVRRYVLGDASALETRDLEHSLESSKGNVEFGSNFAEIITHHHSVIVHNVAQVDVASGIGNVDGFVNADDIEVLNLRVSLA